MTLSDRTVSAPMPSALVRAVGCAIATMERLPWWLIALTARIAPAGVFWRSGQTKIDGFALNDTAVALFTDEYQLPLVDPAFAATAAAIAEHVFPVLLVIGLATRFSALALLVMTAVIQVFVYPDAWPTHGTWAVCFLVLIARGPGVISLDHLIARRYG